MEKVVNILIDDSFLDWVQSSEDLLKSKSQTSVLSLGDKELHIVSYPAPSSEKTKLGLRASSGVS